MPLLFLDRSYIGSFNKIEYNKRMDQQKVNSFKIYWLILLFIFLSLGVFSYIKVSLDEEKRLEETDQVTTQDVNSQNETRITLESKVLFPEKKLSSSKQINLPSLQDANKIFILDGNKDLRINEENYVDGTSGFSIVYALNKDMKDVYITIRNSLMRSGYGTTSATRANLGAIIVTENNDLFQKVYLENVREGETKVFVDIINK